MKTTIGVFFQRHCAPLVLNSNVNKQTNEAVDMNGRFQKQGGKNWILPKQVNANRFFWDSHWLEIWSNHFCPSMGLNGGSVATDSGHNDSRKEKKSPCLDIHVQIIRAAISSCGFAVRDMAKLPTSPYIAATDPQSDTKPLLCVTETEASAPLRQIHQINSRQRKLKQR